MTSRGSNIVRPGGRSSRRRREELLRQRGCVVWFTGLSGSGKSTVARTLEELLQAAGRATQVLDGDELRHGLNRDLGFSPADRKENLRRAGAVAALFADAGLIVLCAFISPYRESRGRARAAAGDGPFVEVHLDAPLAECERRDPKGLYRRARAGEIEQFTGISAPYEAPEQPDLRIDTSRSSALEAAETVRRHLAELGVLAPC